MIILNIKIIKEAAIFYKGVIYVGKRHCNCFIKVNKATGDRPIKGIQGFIDINGKFYNRKNAAKIALANGQIDKLKYSNTDLYSEDLY